jgi:hypothetical protein
MLKQIETFSHILDIDIFVPQYGNPYVQSNNVYEQNPVHSMITVVEFKAKQASGSIVETGSRYMPTDKLYINYFFMVIALD